MWDKRKLVLVAGILITLSGKVSGRGVKLRDSATGPGNNTHGECHTQALEMILHSGLLEMELDQSIGFHNAWNRQVQCSKVMPGKLKEHTAALLAYAGAEEDFKNTFDDSLETLGNSSNENSHFKSLYFLIIDSMMLLPPEECKTMYVVQDEKCAVKKGSVVRFGEFPIVHPDPSVLKESDLDGMVVFNITSCLFVNLGANICREEQETLLSPSEIFSVEDVIPITDEDDGEYTKINLKHVGVMDSDNCNIFSRSPDGVSPLWPKLVLMALYFLCCNC